MPDIRLVNQASFVDSQDLLVTSGVRGVFVFHFDYKGKYNAKLAAQVDQKGRYIEIDLLDQRPIDYNQKWSKGLKIDDKNDLIISWNQQCVSFNKIRQDYGDQEPGKRITQEEMDAVEPR